MIHNRERDLNYTTLTERELKPLWVTQTDHRLLENTIGHTVAFCHRAGLEYLSLDYRRLALTRSKNKIQASPASDRLTHWLPALVRFITFVHTERH